jgi:anti-anti-sigma factor
LEIEAHITASVTVPGEVRALLRRLRGDLSARVYENARLLASEVATNAVLHAARGAPIRFHAELDDCLRIQIRNHSGVDRPVVATGDREQEFEVEFDAARLAVVRLLGEHDISTTQALAERLSQLVESGSPLIFDLSDADFLDSSVIHVIEDARNRGVQLAVVAPPDAKLVPRFLEITGLVKQSRSSRPRPRPRSPADRDTSEKSGNPPDAAARFPG